MINKVSENPFNYEDEYSITDIVETLNEVVDELNKLLKQQEEVTEPQEKTATWVPISEPYKYEGSMLKEDAKKIIFNQWQAFLEDNIDYGGVSEAYKMAIKYLEQPSFEEWLSSFNTNSAPQCFNAVQELKKKVGF